MSRIYGGVYTSQYEAHAATPSQVQCEPMNVTGAALSQLLDDAIPRCYIQWKSNLDEGAK